MAATCSFLSLTPLITSSTISTPKVKPTQLIRSNSNSSSTATHFGFARSNNTIPPLLLRHKNNNTTIPKPAAVMPTAASASDAIPAQTAPDTATSTIISALLFIAFVGLSILTIGVLYIAATDFLQKREGEKFQKEEAEKKKKGGGKKRQMKARAGPKGFGQKIVEADEADDYI
uniref:Transmembrane protein n=1 Tax=Kalanchoe fedtschenkoi TaxID=63787 RepID=A0A7N0ULD4_KALFE